MLTPAKRLRLTESVVDQLIARIRSGVLGPGAKLPSERELMRRAGVGRSSIREALQTLIGMNMIEARQGRGYFVRASTWEALPTGQVHAPLMEAKALLDLIDARLLVEPEIAALAAQTATPPDIEGIERALDRIASLAKRGRKVYRAAAEFHIEIAKATHNAALMQMVSSLVGVMAYWGRLFEEEMPGRARREVELHGELLRCLKRQDCDVMRRAMQEHIAATRRALIAYTKSQG